MPDITSIVAAITGVKDAIEIAKALRAADKSLEQAEYKLKMSQLIDSLLDAREKAQDAKDLLQEKDIKIAELEKMLEFSGKLGRQYDAYYELQDGVMLGEPYCSHCWEVGHKPVHLIINDRSYPFCPSCKNVYGRSRAKTIEASAQSTNINQNTEETL